MNAVACAGCRRAYPAAEISYRAEGGFCQACTAAIARSAVADADFAFLRHLRNKWAVIALVSLAAGGGWSWVCFRADTMRLAFYGFAGLAAGIVALTRAVACQRALDRAERGS